MEIWGFFGILLQISCGIVGGLFSYLFLHWSHIRFQLDLDYRLSDLEGRVNREVKIRAAEKSSGNRKPEKELLDQIRELQTTTQPAGMNLSEWTKQKFKG